MGKKFIFLNPEQLAEAEKFCKEGGTANLARVWRMMQRKAGECKWDGRIGVHFYTADGKRTAAVFKGRTDSEYLEVAKLKYAPALEWCRQNLKEG